MKISKSVFIAIICISLLISGCSPNTSGVTTGKNNKTTVKVSESPAPFQSGKLVTTDAPESVTPDPSAATFVNTTENTPSAQPTPVATYPPVNTRGNSNANISNSGLVARQGDWLYYIDVAPRGNLYKMRYDKTGNTLLYEGAVNSINVVGDWVYFQNYNVISISGSIVTVESNLYKVKTDGSELTDMKCKIQINSGLLVVGDWMYFTSNADDPNIMKIYKMRTDGTEKIKLSDERCSIFQVEGDWIYYSANAMIFKMKTDGSENTKLLDNESNQFIVDGSFIYYNNTSDGRRIYRIDTSGAGKTKITEDSSGSFNISDGYIYFSDLADLKALSKVNINGGNKTRIDRDAAYYIAIFDDMIYYFIFDQHVPMNRIPTDGSKAREVFD